MSVCLMIFVRFVTGAVVVRVAESLSPPERHCDQARHVKRGTGRRDGADNPQQPTDRYYSVETVFQRISSFDQKPLNGMMPQIASQPARKVRYVYGMYFFRPPMRRMSCS